MQGAVIVTPRLYLRRMGNEDIAQLILEPVHIKVLQFLRKHIIINV